MPQLAKFSVNKFEYYCYRGEHEPAGRELVALLSRIDNHYGVLMDIDEWAQSGEARDIMDDHLLTRLTSAITSLVTDPEFHITDHGGALLLQYQRWLAAMFAASPFRNADHILRTLGLDAEARNSLQLRTSNLRKFQLFYLPESEVRLDWDAFWQHDKVATAGLALAQMSSRFLATPSAHAKRELLLRWLPERLDQVESVDVLPMGVMHDVYMHCSYADIAAKHDIKKPINTLIRRKLATLGLFDTRRPAARSATGKPVVLVVLEWFSKNHSIYRTHSQTMVAMRDKFHLVGMGFDGRVDDAGREVFHEFLPITGGNVWENARHVQEVSESFGAQMLYMPSVGMFPITMVLACLRVAPLQWMALGHPATTHGHAMDYVVVEEDYVGDEACFSETLLKLPSDGMPYRPPAALLELNLPEKPPRPNDGPVRIAVAATTIKLNPGFFEACAEIAQRASVPLQFHFLVGQASGLVFPQVRNLVRRIVGESAIVHKHQNYHNYMRVIAGCDLFLNPFPFGNTNGIVDTVWAGLVGVCKTGREVHEHIDEGMFRRLGFPAWTIAQTREQYVIAALRLIDDRAEREALAARLAGPQAIEKLIFKGRPEILGKRMQTIWNEKIDAPTTETPEVPLEALPTRSAKEILIAAERAQSAEDCLKLCQEAMRCTPYRFDVAHRTAMQLLRWQLHDEVDVLWQQTVERLAGEWQPRLYQFLHMIARGRFQEGFALRAAAVAEWPWKRRTGAEPPATYPAWTGQPLNNKRIVIWSEFGLGDEVFFMRFARMLRERAGASAVTVMCQPPLVDLFVASGEADAVFGVDRCASLPAHDYWVYPHDIPAWLPLTLDTLPVSVPYLRVPAEASHQRLPGRDGALKVGIVFKGQPTHENDRFRSLPTLSVLDPLFAHDEVDFYSLQKGNGADEAAAYAARKPNFHDLGVKAETMLDTVRAIAKLDLVITVDTSVAHVAGAMGKPTWLLLPAYADWRWFYVREDSPWYPTMKLFRHPFHGSWAEVVTRVNGHLLERIAAQPLSANLE